jgi:preprotein translocase subunit SecY
MARESLSGAKSGLKELKNRLFFLLVALIFYRLGSYIPVPGIDPSKLAQFFNSESNSVFGLFNMFSGGALSRLSLFALGIMPYISASIIVQLLSSLIPSLQALKKEGESGQRKMIRYTRFATLFLALIQSFGMSRYIAEQGLVYFPSGLFYLTATLTLTTGTVFLMWLGEQITERGVGNGISLLIFASIVSGLPTAVSHTFDQVRQGNLTFFALLVIFAVIALALVCVVFVERAQRRITINYPKRQQGNKIFSAQSSHLPFKINISGVIPPIFASAVLLFPMTISQWFSASPGMSWLAKIGSALSPPQPLYMICYAILVIFFCFFYAAMVFNPRETAENLKRSGAFVPGIRPGEQTAKFIDSVMSRITLSGGIYVTLVSLLPMFLMLGWNVPFYFGGTSLLIVVVVMMDFMAQIQSHLMSAKYDSLLNKSKFKKSGSSSFV